MHRRQFIKTTGAALGLACCPDATAWALHATAPLARGDLVFVQAGDNTTPEALQRLQDSLDRILHGRDANALVVNFDVREMLALDKDASEDWIKIHEDTLQRYTSLMDAGYKKNDEIRDVLERATEITIQAVVDGTTTTINLRSPK